MIIDTDKIQALLDDESISDTYIEKETTLIQIRQYRTGKKKIGNMTLNMAMEMQSLYEYIQKEKRSGNIKGLEKAVSDFNKCQSAAVVYFNKKEWKIWTTIYDDLGLHDDYMDENIVILLQKGTCDILTRYDKTTINYLELLCKIELALS
ncbi:hypothetical protein ACPE2W_002441 [Enterococcus hirae]